MGTLGSRFVDFSSVVGFLDVGAVLSRAFREGGMPSAECFFPNPSEAMGKSAGGRDI